MNDMIRIKEELALIQSKIYDVTKEEFDELKHILIFQNGTSSWGGTRKLPFAFTEQGLAMLSGILNSDIAINTNISIMRAFVAIRQGLTVANSQKELESLKLRIKALEESGVDTQNAIKETRTQGVRYEDGFCDH